MPATTTRAATTGDRNVSTMSRFDTHRSKHQPLWGEHHYGEVLVTSLMETSSPGTARLDDLRVLERDGGQLRLGVCDPALGLVDAHPTGRTAGQLAMFGLEGGADLTEIFSAVNAALFRPEARRSTSISLTCLAAVDWDPASGELYGVRAGDCQVLVMRNGDWEPLFTGPILTDEARMLWKAAAPQRDRVRHLADHDRILGHPGAWVTAPLGQFAEPLMQTASRSGVTAVAISSDGIELDRSVIEDLPAAWSALHDRPENWPHDEPHGDIAVAVTAVSSRPC